MAPVIAVPPFSAKTPLSKTVGNLRQQSGGSEVGGVHAFSTSRPSFAGWTYLSQN